MVENVLGLPSDPWIVIYLTLSTLSVWNVWLAMFIVIGWPFAFSLTLTVSATTRYSNAHNASKASN